MAKRADLEVLNRVQCLDLLHTVRVGRLVFTEEALPAVQPVNFRMHQGHVVIRIDGGGKLAAATERSVVAFQADDLDRDLLEGWSVTVVGHAEPIRDVGELVEMTDAWPQPWVQGRRDHIVRILTERVTGRRLLPPVENGARAADGRASA